MNTPTCPICGEPWRSDEEPVCDAPACQAVFELQWKLDAQGEEIARLKTALAKLERHLLDTVGL